MHRYAVGAAIGAVAVTVLSSAVLSHALHRALTQSDDDDLTEETPHG